MNQSAITPPVIRVFLSSTFADMQNERHYFNTILQPKLSEMCQSRGVSFFSVDLRWGITEEEQLGGKVLPICLSEVDKCRPYFIGIIGNRYGWVIHEITENMRKTIPWLAGKEGKSITELEMLYGVLDEELHTETKNSAFYIRSEQLSKTFYPQEEAEPEALARLKETVMQNPHIRSDEYSSLEQFGELILRDFREWLDREYPVASVAADARKRWYNTEFRRNYIDFPEMERFLDYYLANDRKTLMLFGDGKRGKTAFLTNWALDRERSLLVNCRSDAAFNYWPSIAFEIVRKMMEMEPDVSMPDFTANASLYFAIFGRGKAKHRESGEEEADTIRETPQNDMYFVTDRERDSFRTAFVKWLSELSFEKTVYIVINDLEMLDDAEARLLTWLPAVLPESVRLICSSNDPEIIENARILSWNLKEMPLFPKDHAKMLLEHNLKDFGKGLSAEQKNKVLTSPLAQYPGYLKYIVSFLNRYGVFETLSEMTSKINAAADMVSMYEYSLDTMLADFTREERAAFLQLLAYLRCNTDALLEQDYYSLLSAKVPCPAILWSRFRSILEQLDVVKGEYWEIGDRDLCRYIDKMGIDAAAAELALGKFYMQRLQEEKQGQSILDEIRRGTGDAKYAIRHLKASGNPTALIEGLTNSTVLFYLCKVDWHIERGGWVHLMLQFDADIPTLIRRTILENQERGKDSKLICRRLAQLIPDLEYRYLASDFSELIGEEVNGELFMVYVSSVSDAFRQVYDQVCDYKNAHQFDMVIKLIEETFSKPFAVTDREKAKLLTLKADAERNLKLTDNCLRTCAENYFTALRTADLSLIAESLMNYGHVLYFTGEYKKAKEILERTKSFALLNGELRTYLSACNVEGMCNYRQEEYAESLRLFEQCRKTWEKAGNDRELASVNMNICNLYYLKGDNKTAIRIAEETVQMLQQSASANARRLIPMLLSNIGKYQVSEKDAGGEDTLRQALEQLEKNPDAVTSANTRRSLAEYYKDKGLTVKAAAQYEALAHFYYDRAEYGGTVWALKNLFECLMRGRFDERYKQTYRKWEDAFSRIPNGLEYFREEMSGTAVDEIRLSELEEQIVVARAEGNLQKEAQLQEVCSDLLADTDLSKALSRLAGAAEIYQRLHDAENYSRIAENGIGMLMNRGALNREAMAYFVSMLPPEEQEMVKQWETMRRISDKLQTSYEETTCRQFQELTEKLLDSDYPLFAVRLLSEQLPSVLSYCSDETVRNLLSLASETPGTKRMLWHATTRADQDSISDLKSLMEDYSSSIADCLVRKQENLIILLAAAEHPDAAGVAGNIALIFRRRKDKDKTVYYHKKSMDFYKREEKTHDYLIEKMNLATAYKEFQMIPEAMQILREALVEAHDSGEQMMEASIAGNLATLLMKCPELADSEGEILALFAIEESIFLEGQEYREYTISLCNQLIYLIQLPDPNLELIEKKLLMAKVCIIKFRFREFEPTIQAIESVLYKKKEEVASKKKNAGQVQEKGSLLQRFLKKRAGSD